MRTGTDPDSERGLRLMGIGLGPNTEHVRNFYPESIAIVKPERLADEIGGLLRRALKGLSGIRAIGSRLTLQRCFV